MSLPTNKDARRIGSRMESTDSQDIDRFAPVVRRPVELGYWKNLLRQLVIRKARNLMSIGISDDRFRARSVTTENPERAADR